MNKKSPLTRLGWTAEPTHEPTNCPAGLLAALHTEIDNFGLLIGVTASIANALACNKLNLARADLLTTYLPPEPLIYTMFIQNAGANALPLETTAALQAFHARLELNRKLARQLAQAVKYGHDISNNELTGLVEAWRTLASSAYVTLLLTERTADNECQLAPHQQMSTTQRLLRSVTSGHFPCVDDDGTVSVPGWKERRSEQRHHSRDTNVKVWRNSIALSAILTNVSQAGLGLKGVFGLISGDQVRIELDDSRILDGQVIWTVDDGLGVQFFKPLSDTDPLLTIH